MDAEVQVGAGSSLGRRVDEGSGRAGGRAPWVEAAVTVRAAAAAAAAALYGVIYLSLFVSVGVGAESARRRLPVGRARRQ